MDHSTTLSQLPIGRSPDRRSPTCWKCGKRPLISTKCLKCFKCFKCLVLQVPEPTRFGRGKRATIFPDRLRREQYLIAMIPQGTTAGGGVPPKTIFVQITLYVFSPDAAEEAIHPLFRFLQALPKRTPIHFSGIEPLPSRRCIPFGQMLCAFLGEPFRTGFEQSGFDCRDLQCSELSVRSYGAGNDDDALLAESTIGQKQKELARRNRLQSEPNGALQSLIRFDGPDRRSELPKHKPGGLVGDADMRRELLRVNSVRRREAFDGGRPLLERRSAPIHRRAGRDRRPETAKPTLIKRESPRRKYIIGPVRTRASASIRRIGILRSWNG